MLFMVIERFKNTKLIGERFREKGRMMPEGVVYHASWIEQDGDRCWQLMEAESEEPLRVWASRWADLMEFEFVPVLTSADFWAKYNASR